MLLREQREQTSQDGSPWDRTDGWALAGRRGRRLSFRDGGERSDVLYVANLGRYTITRARLDGVRGVRPANLG